jgi:hypothetical protein
MSEAHDDLNAVEADQQHELAIPAVPAYALVPIQPYDAVALAKFQEDIPSVALTKEECHFDPRPHVDNDAIYKADSQDRLTDALPQYAAHVAAINFRLSNSELVPHAETLVPLSICAGWMGATAPQAEELNEQLDALRVQHEERRVQIERAVQREMIERHQEKAAAILPDSLPTIREALYQYEQILPAEQDTQVLWALHSQYGILLHGYCEAILAAAEDRGVYHVHCRSCGLPFATWKHGDEDDDREWPGNFCKATHARDFITAWLRDHQPLDAESEKYYYDNGLDNGAERHYSILKGDLWGTQCAQCGRYFTAHVEMPKTFPAIKHQACSWNCLVWLGRSQKLWAMKDYVDPELSRGSEWWNGIKLVPFPTDSIAEVKRQTKQPRPARSARIINMDGAVTSATSMLVSPSSIPERIISVLRGLATGESIGDIELKKAAGIKSGEVETYVIERDRLYNEKMIERSGTGYKGNPFKFWLPNASSD